MSLCRNRPLGLLLTGLKTCFYSFQVGFVTTKISLIAILTLLFSSIAINSYADSPVMSIPIINPSSILINQKSDVTISAEVIAPDNNLKEVSVKIKKGSKWVKIGMLQDNWKNGDLSAKDGTYSRRFKFLPKNLKSILLKIVATDKNKKSTEGNINLKVISSKLDAKPEKIVQISGNNQTGNPGEILKEPFVIRVEDELGRPAQNVPIVPSIVQGEGEIIASSGSTNLIHRMQSNVSTSEITGYTDSNGEAEFRVKLGNSEKDLKIIVTSPLLPNQSVSFLAIVGSVDTTDIPVDLAISGNYAFLAVGPSGLQIVNISNPSKPKTVNTFDMNSLYSLSVADNICYAADYNKLNIIDVSNPENIDFKKDSDSNGIPDAELASINLPKDFYDTPFKTTIKGKYLYLLFVNYVEKNGKLKIIDISNPSLPVISSSVSFENYPTSLAVYGDYAYVAAGNSGITILDVKVPFSPAIMNSFGKKTVFSAIAISGNCLYYLDYKNNLHAVDISIPSDPKEINSIPTSIIRIEGDYIDIAIAENFAYIVSQDVGIQVFDISNPKNLSLIGQIDTPSGAKGIRISGNSAYTLDEAFGLYMISIPGSDEKDSDNDGVIDFFDAFPQNPTETLDTDKDGIGNNADDDDDNDGFTDVEEESKNTNPLDPRDFPVELPKADSKIIFVDSKALPRGDGSDNKPYSSITEALLAVKAARASEIQIDEIDIKPGIYSTDKEFFPLTLPSNITLKGSGSLKTIIDAGYTGDAIVVYSEETLSNVIIEEFTIRNGLNSILVNYTDLLTIRNNVIEKNELDGIMVGLNSFNSKIENNIIKQNGGAGVSFFTNSSADMIKNNIISGNESSGIYVDQNSSINEISENTITKNGNAGIAFFENSSAKIIKNNIISGDKISGIYIGESSSIKEVSGNTITGNGTNGISVYNNSSVNVINNVISKNTEDGIFITENSTATIGVDGGKLKITSNGDDGIDIEPDSTATINLNNIFFKGNKDKEIEGKYESK